MAGVTAPIAIGSQLTITRGQIQRFSARDLTPRSLVPYEVHAIRMLAYPTVETPAPTGGATSALKGFLKWQFTAGLIPLTDGFVPMWNLSPVRQSIVEAGGYYEWRFAKPMLLAPGGRIDAAVHLQTSTPNVGASPTITVAVAYVGVLRADLTSMPRMTDVPFASAWDTTVTGYTGLGNPQDALRNPLTKPIDVACLVGRVQNDTTGAAGDDSKNVQIFDPYGRAIHRAGPIQIHALFPTDSRVFPYEGILPVNGRFAVRIDDVPSTTYRPMFSVLGSRREVLS